MDFCPEGIAYLERKFRDPLLSEIMEEDGKQLTSTGVKFLYPGQVNFTGRTLITTCRSNFGMTGIVPFQQMKLLLHANHSHVTIQRYPVLFIPIHSLISFPAIGHSQINIVEATDESAWASY
jgi:hypothetical protein